jgi:hypothetical protein
MQQSATLAPEPREVDGQPVETVVPLSFQDGDRALSLGRNADTHHRAELVRLSDGKQVFDTPINDRIVGTRDGLVFLRPDSASSVTVLRATLDGEKAVSVAGCPPLAPSAVPNMSGLRQPDIVEASGNAVVVRCPGTPETVIFVRFDTGAATTQPRASGRGHLNRIHLFDVTNDTYEVITRQTHVFASGDSLLELHYPDTLGFRRAFTKKPSRAWPAPKGDFEVLAFDGKVAVLHTVDGLEVRDAKIGDILARNTSVHDTHHHGFILGGVFGVSTFERIAFYRLSDLTLLGYVMVPADGSGVLFATARGDVEFTGEPAAWAKTLECREGSRSFPFEACADRHRRRGVALELLAPR